MPAQHNDPVDSEGDFVEAGDEPIRGHYTPPPVPHGLLAVYAESVWNS